MNRIAIISDIHGNLPALNATLCDINSRSIDKIICLGDIIGKGPNSPEALDICKATCDNIVSGNWDKYVSDINNYSTAGWYQNQLGETRLNYLRNLPESIGFYISGFYLRLFHANPHSVYKRVFQTSPLEDRIAMFEVPTVKRIDTDNCQSDIVGYGDIHGSFLEVIDSGKTLFNVGSVGNSCDHIPMCSYTVIEGDIGSRDKTSYSINFHRVEYDNELAVYHANLINDLPEKDHYINEVRTGIYARS